MSTTSTTTTTTTRDRGDRYGRMEWAQRPLALFFAPTFFCYVCRKEKVDIHVDDGLESDNVAHSQIQTWFKNTDMHERFFVISTISFTYTGCLRNYFPRAA